MNRSQLAGKVALVFVCLLFILIGAWLRAIYAPEWLQVDPAKSEQIVRPWAVEADCYSQLARVQRILAGQGLIQSHFKVENWPEGMVPSTTAPFDYVILLVYAPLALFTKYPLDWAGAIVSPLLWLGLAAFWMFFRSREFNFAGRMIFLIGSALTPAIIWATPFGRPRHQSLIFALMALALTAEYERWHVQLTPKRGWHIFAGIAWGLACWTSLYEPLVAVTILVAYNLIVRRRESPAFLISFGTVMLIALLLEGVHIFNIFALPTEIYQDLLRWLQGIKEVQGIGYDHFIQQILLLLLVFVMPFIAWRLLALKGDRCADWLLVVLTVALTVFSFLQQRWLYYASLTELFLIVRYCQISPGHWARVVVMALFSLGLVYDNVAQIQKIAGEPANQPSQEMSLIASAIDEPGAIMAPWWISPGLLYFSGQPIVSGSSHCGISGIVDSAKFYNTTSWLEAEHILNERKVRWVVVFDDKTVYNGRQFVYPLLDSSRGILGLRYYDDDNKGDAESTVAQLLVNDQRLPSAFRPRAITGKLKLYKYEPDGQ